MATGGARVAGLEGASHHRLDPQHAERGGRQADALQTLRLAFADEHVLIAVVAGECVEGLLAHRQVDEVAQHEIALDGASAELVRGAAGPWQSPGGLRRCCA